jgi:type IV pilus assembly protein PilE
VYAAYSSNQTACHFLCAYRRLPLADVLSGHYSAAMKEIVMKERKKTKIEGIAKYQQQNGFTLLELLIVLGIIGILSAISIPAYRDYIIRGKIIEATSNLSDMRIKLEQFYQDNRTYVGACVGGTIAPLPTGSNANTFTYSCPTLTATTFLVRALGNASEGMSGFDYTINQSNAKATVSVATGWTLTAGCWVTKKDGSC